MLTLAFPAWVDPAVELLGNYPFPKAIAGMPAKLSDFEGLETNSFVTNDGVRLNYWEAGSGDPIVFVPACGASGAEMLNELRLLSQTNHVYVLDQRIQCTSERTLKGQRVARYSMNRKEFLDHIGTEKTALVGWSMGVSVIWGYVDLFGTDRITKAVIVDEPVSIYTHDNWSEEERLNAGGMTTSVERMIGAYQGAPTNHQIVDMKVVARAGLMGTDYAANARGWRAMWPFKADPSFGMLVLFDHAKNDWRDVVTQELDIPVAVFSGEESNNLPSQDWIARSVPQGKLYSYTGAEEGDHFLLQKNPLKFVDDLRGFLAE